MIITTFRLFFFFVLLTLSVLTVFFLPQKIVASDQNINCANRYVTLANPVRGRDLWLDKSLKPILDQYNLISDNGFTATWLLHYDVFSDQELLGEIKKFNNKQEKGIFLEISKRLANDARVIYSYNKPWFSPAVIFLSSYSQSERRRLIDQMFKKFYQEYGYFPKSIGAWWIDSYSLNYMKEKYGIIAALIVADQRTTDNYGVWGQWWGVPYYPSKANILTPADNLKDKQDIVIIQWAQRDLSLAYGSGSISSNYSLQANDYISQGKSTAYFEDLVKIYEDCQNPLGQVTVGLETGIESVGFIKEYGNQLEALKQMKSLQTVTMNEFAERFKQVYQDFPQTLKLKDGNTIWEMTTDFRRNTKLKDGVIYKPGISFKDYFLADNATFLDRQLPGLVISRDKEGVLDGMEMLGRLVVIVMIGVIGGIAYLKKWIRFWIIGTFFSFAAFGLILKSHVEYGWIVYYGAKVPWLFFTQIILVLISLALVWGLRRVDHKKIINLWLLLLVFGIDPIIWYARYTFVSEKYYFGFIVDAFKFIGFSFTKPFQLSFVNMDFPAYQAAALLRFDVSKIWDNLWLSLIVYPLVHLIIAFGLGLILIGVHPKIRKIVLGILIVLVIWHLVLVWNSDPRAVGSLGN